MPTFQAKHAKTDDCPNDEALQVILHVCPSGIRLASATWHATKDLGGPVLDRPKATLLSVYMS